MILPTKQLSEERSLIHIGAEILELLYEPKTVSRLWNEIQIQRNNKAKKFTLTFDWFILALDLLYIMNAIDFENGRIRRNLK